MTLILKRDIDPGAHALVIGCGSYPYAGSTSDTLFVPPLVSAPRSARELAQWLIEHRDDLEPPLASLELLLAEPIVPADGSPPQHSKNVSQFDTAAFGLPAADDPRGGVLDVGQPNFADLKKAIKDWHARVNASADAAKGVSLFYAVGHGFQTSAQLYLPYDFGEDPNVTWNEVLALDEFSVNSISLKAFRQILIGDCCRTELPVGYAAPQVDGDPVLGPVVSALKRQRAQLEVFSAPKYSAAEGDRNGVSNLMQRLIEALNGAWCDEPDAFARHWVTGKSVHEYLKEHTVAVSNYPGGTAELLPALNVGDAELRVSSLPGRAILSSSQCVIRRKAPPAVMHVRPAGSAAEVWIAPVPVGDVYEVEIGFAPPTTFLPRVQPAYPVRPKPYPVTLKVTP